MAEAAGIPAHDLARDMVGRSMRTLAELIAADARAYSPLRIGLSPEAMEANRRRVEEANRAREREVSVALAAALVDWEAVRHALAGNPVAVAVLGIHKPVRGYQRAVCSGCGESDGDDTVPVDWPCTTFTAIEREAAGD